VPEWNLLAILRLHNSVVLVERVGREPVQVPIVVVHVRAQPLDVEVVVVVDLAVAGPPKAFWFFRRGGEGFHAREALEAARLGDGVDEDHVFSALVGFFQLLSGAESGGPYAFPVAYVHVGRLDGFHHEVASWRDEFRTLVDIFLQL